MISIDNIITVVNLNEEQLAMTEYSSRIYLISMTLRRNDHSIGTEQCIGIEH